MKLFAKIFLCGTLVFCLSFLPAGYFLIAFSYENSIKKELEYALTEYQYDKFTVQVRMFTNPEDFAGDISPGESLLSELAAALRGPAAFFTQDKNLLFSNLGEQVELSLLDTLQEEALTSQFREVNGDYYIVVCGKVVQSGNTIYLVTAKNINEVVAAQRVAIRYFQKVYIIALAGSMVLLLLFSLFLTRPIKRLTNAAGRIAGGNYGERLSITGNDEIGELAENFNRMAATIEGKITELSDAARQKEAFVSSFAHELKTPLTSVIGYADMMYQGSLSAKEVKEAAGYILHEGLRLEALSLKLMDLIVLNRQEFLMEEMPVRELLQDIIYGMALLFAEKGVSSHLEVEPSYLKVEYDLFKTLLLNLIDNSIKAGCTEIWISGKRQGDLYTIGVADNGRGIPASDIDHITEAFYTVDKSRSRKHHGVGLGLALAEKIAKMHGSRLTIRSEQGMGTTVEIRLQGVTDELCHASMTHRPQQEHEVFLNCKGGGQDA